VLSDALDDYMFFYQASETYKIMETTVEFNTKQLAMVSEKFKLGEATRTDVAQASAELSKAEAQRLVAFSNLESAKAKFIKTFTTEPTDVALPDAPANLPESLDALTTKALTSNFTLQQVKNGLAAAKAMSVSAKGNLLPNVDFKAQMGSKYYNPEIPAGLGDQYQGYTNNKSLTTSLSVTIPIFSKGGAEYSNIRRANSAARMSAHQLDDELGVVKTNAISSWTGYNAAKAAIVSSDQSVEAFALVLEGIEYEYNVDSKAILDVLKARRDLDESKLQNIKTKKDCITSAYQMKALTGEMTALALKLPVKYFNPGTEFRKVKAKIIGF
jgi:outer membrane protein